MSEEESEDICRICGDNADDDFHKNLCKVPDFSTWPSCPVCGRNIGQVAYIKGSFAKFELEPDIIALGIADQLPADGTLYCDYCWWDVFVDIQNKIRLARAAKKSVQFSNLSSYDSRES